MNSNTMLILPFKTPSYLTQTPPPKIPLHTPSYAPLWVTPTSLAQFPLCLTCNLLGGLGWRWVCEIVHTLVLAAHDEFVGLQGARRHEGVLVTQQLYWGEYGTILWMFFVPVCLKNSSSFVNYVGDVIRNKICMNSPISASMSKKRTCELASCLFVLSPWIMSGQVRILELSWMSWWLFCSPNTCWMPRCGWTNCTTWGQTMVREDRNSQAMVNLWCLQLSKAPKNGSLNKIHGNLMRNL